MNSLTVLMLGEIVSLIAVIFLLFVVNSLQNTIGSLLQITGDMLDREISRLETEIEETP
jgi:hypothetical protein